MKSREEIISDLETNISWIEDIEAHQFPGWLNVTSSMRNAIVFLKASAQTEPDDLPKTDKARVLTISELLAAHVAFAEDIDKEKIIPVLVDGEIGTRVAMVKTCPGEGDARFFYPMIAEYNKRWRCWDHLPSDEERKAAVWNG